MNSEWIDLDEEIEELSLNENYIFVDLGIQIVDPINIIALSRKLDDRRLEDLRKKILLNSWHDIHPNSLSLILLPSGKYAVSDGGNHRAYLSKELGIESIKANVCTYMEKSLLSTNEHAYLASNEKNRTELFSILRSKKRRNESCDVESEQLDLINQQERNFLKDIYLERSI